MSDVLLINPPAGGRGRLAVAAPPHLGLASVAAVAEKTGYSVSILDYGFSTYERSRLETTLEGEKPRVIGVSVVSPSLRGAATVCRDVRTLQPEAVLVVGGPHVSADPEIVGELDADYGFVGEAERGFSMLCDFVLGGVWGLREIPGLIYASDGGLRKNRADFIEDLDELPNPALHLHSLAPNEPIPVATSRGCPFACTYCTQARSMKVRYRSPERVVDEIASLAGSRNTNLFSFVDDVFTLERERTLDLCGMLRQRFPKLRWTAITRADCVDEELLSAMRGAGCFHLSFGVESGVEEIRFRLGKEVPDEDYVKAFGLCRKHGVRSCAYAMYGLPGETWEDMQATTRFIKTLSPAYGFFKTTVLMPESGLFRQAVCEGKIMGDVWREFMHGSAPIPNYIPDGLSLDDVEFARMRAVKNFYLRAGFVRDHVAAGCGWLETLGLVRLAGADPDCFS